MHTSSQTRKSTPSLLLLSTLSFPPPSFPYHLFNHKSCIISRYPKRATPPSLYSYTFYPQTPAKEREGDSERVWDFWSRTGLGTALLPHIAHGPSLSVSLSLSTGCTYYFRRARRRRWRHSLLLISRNCCVMEKLWTTPFRTERERDENGVSTYLRTYYARELEPFFRPNLECLYRAGSWDFIRFSENFSNYAY